MVVVNTGDRPIQIGSHIHLPEVNDALEFDRAAAHGFRLDIPSGTSQRFEPGPRASSMRWRSAAPGGCRVSGSRPRERARSDGLDQRSRYAAIYGPTTGDQVRLGDTDLWIEIEEDRTFGGEEAVFGGGKSIRESMAQATTTRAGGALDTVITNAIILDWWGIVRADIGIRDGRIVGIGHAGNPDVSDGIDMVIGPSDRRGVRRGAASSRPARSTRTSTSSRHRRYTRRSRPGPPRSSAAAPAPPRARRPRP